MSVYIKVLLKKSSSPFYENKRENRDFNISVKYAKKSFG